MSPMADRSAQERAIRERSVAKYRRRAIGYDETCGPTWPIRERTVAALGLAWAGVDPGARGLSVEVTTPDRVAPRGPFEAAVRVEGVEGGGEVLVFDLA